MDQNLQQMQGQLLVLNANLDIDIARLKAKKARVLEELKEVTEALQKQPAPVPAPVEGGIHDPI